MKILLVGHACSPGLGSEPGLTWNWAWHLSSFHQVWVLTHPQYRKNIERFLAENPNPNLRIIWVTLPPLLDPWSPVSPRNIRLHYVLWQRTVYREALRLNDIHHFDVVHHVSWNTVSSPPLLWRLPIPFIWGPVGGGQTAPPAFKKYFGDDWRKEAIRALRIKLLPHLPSMGRAVRSSALIFATNYETAHILERIRGGKVQLFFDNGIPSNYGLTGPPKREITKELRLFWAGRLEARKALPLALEALAQVGDLPVKLVVAGTGPLRESWESLAEELKIKDKVEFIGLVPWNEMPEQFMKADAFFFSSLQDSFGSVVLEAMAYGLPILTLNHQGVGILVPDNAGIKVSVTTPEESVAGLADGIRRLFKQPEARLKMGEAAWAYAITQTWERRAEQMSAWYEACLTETTKAPIRQIASLNS